MNISLYVVQNLHIGVAPRGENINIGVDVEQKWAIQSQTFNMSADVGQKRRFFGAQKMPQDPRGGRALVEIKKVNISLYVVKK